MPAPTPPTSPLPPDASTALARMFDAVAAGARAAGVFAAVDVRAGGASPALECTPSDCPEEAFYRLDLQDGVLWVSLVTPHRYLSQSIEQDLVHTGDKLHELLGDELIEQGFTAGAPAVEHFRSPAKLFTFRSRLPFSVRDAAGAANHAIALQFLLAFEATFRPLGDMSAGGES